MKLRDIFTEAFWKARWKETLDGFAAYGCAVTGQPLPKPDEPQPPAPDAATKPTQPGGPA